MTPKEPWSFILFAAGLLLCGLAVAAFIHRRPIAGAVLIALALVSWHFLGRP